MGDMIDYFRDMKSARSQSRREALSEAQSEWIQFVEAAEAGGYTLRIMSDFHWNVYRNSRAVAQYWPSANKWQITSGGKVHHGSREQFRRAMREGRL